MMERVFEYIISDEYSSSDVAAVLRHHFKMSSTLIKKLRNTECGLLLNGEHVRTVDKVKTGDNLKITIEDKLSENIKPVKLPIDIVYEDEDILIINKPPYMPTHISFDNYDNSLANAVTYYYMSKGEERAFRAVNRLDKYTSGLMAVAKNSYAHARLADDMHTDSFERRYRCIVTGDIDRDGIVDAPIKRKDGSAIERTVASDGKRAVTHYKVLHRFGQYTLLEIKLETGRTHQIRVHMAYIGHPLVGDWLYGEENHEIASRQMLHSCYIALAHPVTGKKIEFESDLADDMKAFVTSLLSVPM